MKIYALVEGVSEQIFLERWAERFLKGHELKAHPHQGKGRLPGKRNATTDRRRRGLLDQLPSKLAAFGKSLNIETERVLVLVDADTEDPMQLSLQLRELLREMEPRPHVFFSVAVEELEAFYLGDLKALAAAYPKFNRKLAKEYKPDSVCGTWEQFGKIVGDGGGNKVAWAEVMGKVLTTKPAESRSPSFRELCEGLLCLVRPENEDARPARNAKPRKATVATPRDASGRRNR